MKMQIGRWGNSLAVRLPKELVERYGLEEGLEIDSAIIEQALKTEQDKERQRLREQALADIAAARWTLPPDWKFDREEANAR
jgi:antitoxin MazE